MTGTDGHPVRLQMSTGQMTEEERKMAQQKAMQDPEIQLILTDPIMRQVPECSVQTCPLNCQSVCSKTLCSWQQHAAAPLGSIGQTVDLK